MSERLRPITHTPLRYRRLQVSRRDLRAGPGESAHRAHGRVSARRGHGRYSCADDLVFKSLIVSSWDKYMLLLFSFLILIRFLDP